jgi:hypothetical protein
VDAWVLSGMIAVVARDGLDAALRGALEAAYDRINPHDCVPLADRAGRLEALATKLHTLEVEEETVIMAAARDGIRLDRRPDASPAAIFAVLEESTAA